MPVNKLTARMLETFYAELRRCRVRCDGRPFLEHKVAGEHDCKAATEAEAAAARRTVASGGRKAG